jgi:hypothetical protein
VLLKVFPQGSMLATHQLRFEPPRNGAYDVHDVAVALHKHEPVHLHAAKLADATNIIAAEIYQHHVLGALFFVVHHFVFKAQVFFFCSAARPCSGDWPVLHFAVVNPHQQLR